MEVLAVAPSAQFDVLFCDLMLLLRRGITCDREPGTTKEGTGNARNDVASIPVHLEAAEAVPVMQRRRDLRGQVWRRKYHGRYLLFSGWSIRTLKN